MRVDFTHANAPFFPLGYPCPELFRRVFLGTYYPKFRAKILKVKAAAFARGHAYVSEYGFRSWSEQLALRANYLAGKGGRAAPPGYSAHQFGLADDSTADSDIVKEGLQPTWAPAAYDELGKQAALEDLDWGAAYGDRPHLNLKGFTSGAQLAPLRTIWLADSLLSTDARLLKVWAYLDTLQT